MKAIPHILIVFSLCYFFLIDLTKKLDLIAFRKNIKTCFPRSDSEWGGIKNGINMLSLLKHSISIQVTIAMEKTILDLLDTGSPLTVIKFLQDLEIFFFLTFTVKFFYISGVSFMTYVLLQF